MALKYQIKKEEHDKLDDGLKALYSEGDDGYTLAVEGMPDVSEYKTRVEKMDGKISELLQEKKDLKAKFEEADGKLRDALANGNNEEKLESLRKSYDEKIERLQADMEKEVGNRDKFIERTLIDKQAIEMASGLAIEGASKVLLPHVKSRLAIEKNGDDYRTVILDADGKPSASTLDDLKNEFANDPAFSHVVVGSKASGGGAASGRNGGGAANRKFNELTGAELSQIRKENPDEYERLRSEFYR